MKKFQPYNSIFSSPTGLYGFLLKFSSTWYLFVSSLEKKKCIFECSCGYGQKCIEMICTEVAQLVHYTLFAPHFLKQ